MAAPDWFLIRNIHTVDTPALAVYPDRAKENIRIVKTFVPGASALRPHMKTSKSGEIARMLIDAGIHKFKCATIAEAEMLAIAGAADVLLAYQPVGPKVERLGALVKKFRNTTFSCLIDGEVSARQLSESFHKSSENIRVFIDVNVGMNRTGIAPSGVLALAVFANTLPGITLQGLHAYDGHLRDTDLAVRTRRCDEAFAPLEDVRTRIEETIGRPLTVIAGGTPTFPIHAKRKNVECSPGTFIYWDKGYESILTEQPFVFAALVVTRVVSKPNEQTLCLDLGHKSIASENALTNRVTFLNAPDLKPIGHSEEHMVMEAPPGNAYAVGDVLYGVPYHICPTVALHDRAAIVTDGEVKTYWKTEARNRIITV